MDEELRDKKIAALSSLKSADEARFKVVLDSLLRDWPEHIPLLLAHLKVLDDGPRTPERLDEVVKAADAILAKIDGNQVAVFFALNKNAEMVDATEVADMDARRSAMLEALNRKCLALAEKPASQEQADQFKEAYGQLERWVETSDAKYLKARVKYERQKERPATALRLLQKALADSTDRALFQLRRELLMELGWAMWDQYDAVWNLIRFPHQYARF